MFKNVSSFTITASVETGIICTSSFYKLFFTSGCLGVVSMVHYQALMFKILYSHQLYLVKEEKNLNPKKHQDIMKTIYLQSLANRV